MADSEEKAQPEKKRIDLVEAEIAILLEACRRFRSTLPSYLQSKQRELELIDGLMRKLS